MLTKNFLGPAELIEPFFFERQGLIQEWLTVCFWIDQVLATKPALFLVKRTIKRLTKIAVM